MPDSVQTHITELLAGAARGDDAAEERLWQAVYAELRAMAGKQMAAESPGRTLQPTALVHEAYLRLTGGAPVKWENRRHFFAAAAKAMRRIRVDDARRRTRRKRGGDGPTMSLPDNVGADGPDPGEMLDIDEALDRLEREFPREARVVMLRYFVGMTGEETAEALGVSPRTVDSDWRYARAWLHRALSDE
ncbi:MAG: sigma-70 family RNA polymerase sigma factor [Planctomycetes bacterium]|nr:sigma-70 family RNA polymerase sigma factor [Planctomycetota bacterium]